jgi:hypothetical protein
VHKTRLVVKLKCDAPGQGLVGCPRLGYLTSLRQLLPSILTPVLHFPNIFGEAMLQKLFKRFIVTLFDFNTHTRDGYEGEGGCRYNVALRQFDTLDTTVINM